MVFVSNSSSSSSSNTNRPLISENWFAKTNKYKHQYMDTCNQWSNTTNILQFSGTFYCCISNKCKFYIFSLFSFCRTPSITVLFVLMSLSCLNIWLLCFVIVTTSRTWFEHNDVIFRLQGNTVILLFPSNETWSASLELGSQELTSSCQEWAWLALIFYLPVFDSCATLWKQTKSIWTCLIAQKS